MNYYKLGLRKIQPARAQVGAEGTKDVTRDLSVGTLIAAGAVATLGVLFLVEKKVK